MPDKRDPEKKMIGMWLSPKEIAELDALCRRMNTNRAELFRRLVGNQINPLGRKTN